MRLAFTPSFLRLHAVFISGAKRSAPDSLGRPDVHGFADLRDLVPVRAEPIEHIPLVCFPRQTRSRKPRSTSRVGRSSPRAFSRSRMATDA